MLLHSFTVKRPNYLLLGLFWLIPALGQAEEKTGCLYNQNESQREYERKLIESRQGQSDDLRTIMARADENGDRKISVEEAVKAGIGNMFLKLDRNKDRFITPVEVNEWLKDEVVADLWKSFRIADKSRDLRIEELELRMSGGLSRFAEQFGKLDSDQDGYLNFLEVMNAVAPDVAQKEWFINRLQKKGSLIAPRSYKLP